MDANSTPTPPAEPPVEPQAPAIEPTPVPPPEPPKALEPEPPAPAPVEEPAPASTPEPEPIQTPAPEPPEPPTQTPVDPAPPPIPEPQPAPVDSTPTTSPQPELVEQSPVIVTPTPTPPPKTEHKTPPQDTPDPAPLPAPEQPPTVIEEPPLPEPTLDIGPSTFDITSLTDDQLKAAAALYAKKNQAYLSQLGVEKRQAVAQKNVSVILAFVAKHSPASNRTIARALNLPPRRVQYYMQLLTHQGKVTATGWGVSREYRIK